MLGKIIRFNITVKHVAAKENLQRKVDVEDVPRFHHKHTTTDHTTHHATVNILPGGVILDPKLLALIGLAEADEDYQSMVEAVGTKAKLSELHQDPLARKVSKMYNRMEIFQAPNGRILLVDGARVFIPEAARQQTLEELHTFHAGTSTMQATAAMNVYWPEMSQEIYDYVTQCVV